MHAPHPDRTTASTLALALIVSAMSPLGGCDRGATRVVARPDAGRTPGSSEPAEARALSAAIAQAIAGVFRQVGEEATVRDATVRAAGHVVTARAEVAETSVQPDHTVVALEVWLDLDGLAQPAFHGVAVGIDANRAEAMEHSVRTWTVQYAIPTVDALRALDHAGAREDAGSNGNDGGVRREPRAVGPYLAFTSPLGLRGEAPEGFDGASLQSELLRRIGEAPPGQVIPAPVPHANAVFHSVNLSVQVRDAQVGQANCRVDGRESEALCRIVRALPWPAGASDVIVRQYIVLAPRERAIE